MKQVTKQPQGRRRLAAAIVVCTVLLAPASDRAAALTGAERMPPESFRFVAYVGDDYGYCTGAIIAPTWVLTAAHCVVKGDGSAIRPDEIGDLSRGWPDDDWERVPVKRVVPHPHYYWQGDGFRNDVALLETVRAFVSSELVPVEVLSLEDEALHAANGTTAVMIGYGEDENGQRDPDGLFRVVSAPLHHADSCRTEHSFVDAREEIVHHGTVCAGDRDHGIRGGDSGGPLLVRTDDGTYGLIGIASISGHDRSGYPVVAVYTRVATVKDWIDGCVLGTGECVEGGVKLTELNRYAPAEVRESETLEQRSTAVIFVNETEKTLSYHWIDFNGNERYYGSVSPGDSISQHTYPGHIWAVKDAEGRTLGVFVAEREMGRAIVTGEAVMAFQDGGDVEDVQVEGDTDFAWLKVDVPWLRWVPGQDTDGGTPNLDEETTPGTWGASARDTVGRPWMYGGVWATFRAHNGDVVQVTTMGNAVYEATYSVAAWRVHGAPGWGDWIYGSGPGRMGVEQLPPGPVTITQAGKLNIPFDDTRSLGDTERWWNTTSVIVIDDVAGMQTAAGCFHTCDAWQRPSAFAVAAVETDRPESANDVHVAEVADEFESAQVEKVIEVATDAGLDLSRDRVARVLDEALVATTLNVHGDEVPDWTTRLRAVELVIKFLDRTE
ncbi:MAG: trypsin-like serine protease [Spirochaetaceae bacterium]|nr:trypsin-like serine protease [Spirochaetaceae bacterium]